MTLLDLQEIYNEYARALGQAHKKSSIFAGLFGQGSMNDPRSDACNKEFYEKTGDWAKQFAQSSPDAGDVYQVVRFILEAACLSEREATYWYHLVAQGHTRELIPLLNPEDGRALARDYLKWYPKRKQLPLQREIAALLEVF